MPFTLRRTSTAALALGVLILPGCAGQSGCGAVADSPATPIVIGAPEPEEPKPAMRPCLVDDPGSCATSGGDGRVVPGQSYEVSVLPTDPVLGPASAPVTLVVFSDFQCPYCAQFESTLEELVDRYPNQLRVVWKDHPLEMHPHAMPAALLAREAYAKGGNDLFWEVHDDLFDAQSDFDTGALQEIADEHDLSWPPEQHFAPLVDTSLEQARNIGVRSTPTCFVNGRAVVGSQPVEAYTSLVDDELAKLPTTASKAP